MLSPLSLQDIFNRWNAQLCWQTADDSLSFHQLEQRVRSYYTAMPAQAGSCWAIRGLSALDTFAVILAGICRGAVMFPLLERLPVSMQAQMLAQVPITGVFTDRICAEIAWPQVSITGWQKYSNAMDYPLIIQAERPAVGIFSSGSTGLPKAIVHSWQSLCSSAQATIDFYGFSPGEKWLLSLDLAHIGGLQIAIRCLLAGGLCVHLAQANRLEEILQNSAADYMSLVPTQLYRFLEKPQALPALARCRAIALGGAAASSQLLAKAKAAGLAVSVSYGCSETAAQCTGLAPGEMPKCEGDVGSVLAGWELRHQGEELWLRGPAAMLGVYSQQKFQAGTDDDGWLKLPDRIALDNRRVTLLGRADGIFQVAGENISALDILLPLEELRSAADFIVLPLPDAEYGLVPALIVRSKGPPELDGILRLWQGKLAGVQRPKYIYWHQSDDISKPSRGFYEAALQNDELSLIWRQDLGKI